MADRHVVLVLGMHRSGTSALAGILQAAGISFGDVTQRSPHNSLGNREHPAVQALNDAVLGFNRGAWDAIPRRIHWTREHVLRRDGLISGFEPARVWGFKDPRNLLTLEFWLSGLAGFDVRFIGTVRHPMAVMRSLRAREPHKDPRLCIQLWLRYNQRLFALWSDQGFPILDFDMAAQDYAAAVIRAVQGLPVAAAAAGDYVRFFDPSLRHQAVGRDSGEAAGEIAASDLRAAMALHRELAAIAADDDAGHFGEAP